MKEEALSDLERAYKQAQADASKAYRLACDGATQQECLDADRALQKALCAARDSYNWIQRAIKEEADKARLALPPTPAELKQARYLERHGWHEYQ